MTHRSVAEIAEHDGEEEGERDDGVDGRIGLPVAGHAVSVDQLLERRGELVGAEERRRRLLGHHLKEKRINCTGYYFDIPSFSRASNTHSNHSHDFNQLYLSCTTSRRFQSHESHRVQDWRHGRSGLLRPSPERQLDGLDVRGRDPTLGDQTLLSHVQVEEVEGVVDGLDLADLDEPRLEGKMA